MVELDQTFADANPSVRLSAALKAGINPSSLQLETLLKQCAVEPDFQVREMLTWALIRLPADTVVPRLIEELSRREEQARSQALHTLSKFRDRSAWNAVAAMLDDESQAVMRTAWYTAVTLVPDDQRQWLAEKLATRLGKGDDEVQLSLSRALIGLGADIIEPLLTAGLRDRDDKIRSHAAATKRLFERPGRGFCNVEQGRSQGSRLGKNQIKQRVITTSTVMQAGRSDMWSAPHLPGALSASEP